jgi:uncharacterized protein YdaU (DUF1376 family)
MNFIDMHLGDYAADTAHLSPLEDGIYWRLLRRYYKTERPLPAEVPEICRLAGARARAEKDAVRIVLREFFVLQEDGWHNARCDREIAEFQAGEPEREARKTNEEERQKRHREERARLFAMLRERDIHPAWDEGIKELRKLVALHCPKPGTPTTDAVTPAATEAATPATQPATAHETEAVTPPATAPATPATATHSPFPTTHSPEGDTGAFSAQARAAVPTPVGEIGKALVRGGIPAHKFSQHNPHVIALSEMGAAPDFVEEVTREAVDEGDKGLGWIAATVQGRSRSAAKLLSASASGAAARRGSRQQPMAPEDRKAAEEAEIAKAMQRRAARNGGGNVIDMEVVNG